MTRLLVVERALVDALEQVDEALEAGQAPEAGLVAFACDLSDEAEVARTRALAFVKWTESQEAFLAGEVAALETRIKRWRRAREWVEGQIVAAMEMHGVQKLEASGRWVALRTNPPRVEVVAETALPPEMVRVTTVYTPDKVAIRDALKAGVVVPGAALVPGSKRLEIGPRSSVRETT